MPEERGRIKTTIRIPKNEYRLINKLSYLSGHSVNQIIIKSIERTLNEQKNILTNADIVLS